MLHASPEPNRTELPPYGSRDALLRSLLEDVALAKDIRVEDLARLTSGLSEGDLAWLCEEALRVARNAHRHLVGARDFEEAILILLRGGARLSLLDADETYQTALHAAAQAIVAWHNPVLGELQQITLLYPPSPVRLSHPARGAGNRSQERARLVARLDVLLAGYVAEGMVPGLPYRSTGIEPVLDAAMQLAWRIGTLQEAEHEGKTTKRPWRQWLQHRLPADPVVGPRNRSMASREELVATRRAAVHALLAAHEASLTRLIDRLLHDEAIDQSTFVSILASHVKGR